MKTMTKFWISAMVILWMQPNGICAQTIDEGRMKRDIEVAENVLATLIKHEIGQQRTLFGMDVKGSYQPGYGVTFRLPPDQSMPFFISIGDDNLNGAAVISDGTGYRYSITRSGTTDDGVAREETYKLKDKAKEKKQLSSDSVRSAYNDAIISAAQNFILDYGDLISQLALAERIVVTNQGDRPHFYFNAGKRTRISVEGLRSDVTAFRQGKLTREQVLKKLSVVNTTSVETREQDMEMLSSIFSRLYRPDLSQTYFVEGNVYYERLKDYGAIFYMQMLSSIERDINGFTLPTVGLENVSQEARDKKVTELYPAFELDLKENILEYGRTVKSLNDNEILVFNISLTKCTGCGIPSTLEVSIPATALRDFASGKISKAEAMNRFAQKMGSKQ